MKIATISKNDCVNSITGFTLAIYFQGCDHYCKGCFSQKTWKWEDGEDWDFEDIKELILESRHKNISLLGGDPLYSKNREDTIKLIDWIKDNTEKEIYLWTGYKMDRVSQWLDITKIDYLIDGKFEEDKKSLKLKLRGSVNQCVYNRGIEMNRRDL